MKEVTPKEAYQLMQDDPDYIYLDVRSVPEFEQGHPVRAINIPLMHFTPGMGMVPNEHFVSVVESALSRDAKIVIGCRSGGRSAHACEILSERGYANLANVSSGFVGAMDSFGRIAEPGWSMLNLPVCTGCEENAAYSFLSSKAGK